jgi:DNA-binding response OmpR family regulator
MVKVVMKQLTVLSVDDDVELQKLVKKFLETKGFRVVTSQDGWDAIRQIIVEKPDAVVMDLEMPKMDGIHALETLRATAVTEHTPIIVASGHADAETILKTAKLGAEDFIVKPFSFEELYKRLSQLLFRMDFTTLQKVLEQLQKPDSQSTAALWSGLDLQRYKNWHALPALFERHELCVLIPHGITVSQAAKFNEKEAAAKVVVLSKVRNTWKGVWPHKLDVAAQKAAA